MRSSTEKVPPAEPGGGRTQRKERRRSRLFSLCLLVQVLDQLSQRIHSFLLIAAVRDQCHCGVLHNAQAQHAQQALFVMLTRRSFFFYPDAAVAELLQNGQQCPAAVRGAVFRTPAPPDAPAVSASPSRAPSSRRVKEPAPCWRCRPACSAGVPPQPDGPGQPQLFPLQVMVTFRHDLYDMVSLLATPHKILRSFAFLQSYGIIIAGKKTGVNSMRRKSQP